ncbi:MAG: bifunctional methionine sulfoxide reductase B/A protein [candidate division Zixibacteria bacterium]|nr:bifunctional methionine sulfoxide reductase B/A protein [candidate division Zixibacteria bacterium]
MSYNKLNPEEERVILNKGTENPFTGKYNKHNKRGTYVCRQCNASLYKSNDKFDSHCGWPSFDDEIKGAVKREMDADGQRTEIICNNCGGHLGHLFVGEGLTDKNVRHCVNSVSLDFIPDETEPKTETAYFAGGCFWGMEHFFQKTHGVISTQVGYMGGYKDNPTYNEVCSGATGHAEALEVVFDNSETNFETLAKLFFETHNPTQENRQGPDIGEQYRSAIYYTNEKQKEISKELIKLLYDKGFEVVTELEEAEKFWIAEDYHQDYYKNNGGTPYCHFYKKRF